MREFLFRGKRIEDGEWIFGFYAEIKESEIAGHYIATGETIFYDGFNTVGYEVMQETVGQYVGVNANISWDSINFDSQQKFLSQGNRKEDWKGYKIFEHDIIIAKRPCVIEQGEVVYLNGAFYFNHKYGLALFNDLINAGHKFEIVGNIFDKNY